MGNGEVYNTVNLYMLSFIALSFIYSFIFGVLNSISFFNAHYDNIPDKLLTIVIPTTHIEWKLKNTYKLSLIHFLPNVYEIKNNIFPH